jgi:hypothetical protein
MFDIIATMKFPYVVFILGLLSHHFIFFGIPEFFEKEEGMVDDGHVVMFRCWVLEDPHVIVAVVDPLK